MGVLETVLNSRKIPNWLIPFADEYGNPFSDSA